MRVMPSALVVLPGPALHFDLDGQVIFLVAQLGPRHDAVLVWVAVRISCRRDHDGLDDGEVLLVRADLLGGLDSAGQPESSGSVDSLFRFLAHGVFPLFSFGFCGVVGL